jgi:AcrR family transcriptional regulator
MRRQIELPPAPDPDPYRDPLSMALIMEVYECGEAASEAGVIARAGVSPSVFAERFGTLEGAAVDVLERLIADYERRVGKAFNAHSDWRSSLRASAYEAADWIEENPEVVSFGMTGVLQMKGELVRVRREEAFVFCAHLIDLGRTEPGSRADDDGSTATFAIGSILQLLTQRLQSGVAFDPHKIVPEMMYSIVRAYLGDAAADEELALPREGSLRPM